MIIQDLITAEFVPASLSSKVSDVLEVLQAYKLTHIPIFEGLTFVGNLSEICLLENPSDETLESCKNNIEKFYLSEANTLFDALRMFDRFETNIIPVLDDNEKYLGYITIDEVISELYKMPFLSELGAMLTVKIPTKQYSMSEITKIIESNNGRIFGSFVSGYSNDMTEVTIRFNAESLSSVVATFERFGYSIKYQFFNDDKVDLLNDRFQQLMKFIEI